MRQPDYGTELRPRRPETPSQPTPTNAGADWAGIAAACLWLLAVLGALVVGVFVGGFFVSIGVSILLADTPLAVAVAPLLAYVGTPCLFGGLTIWAGMTWLDRRERDRNRPPRR